MKTIQLIALVLTLPLAGAMAQPTVAISTFDTDADGWTGIDVQAPPYDVITRGPYALNWLSTGGDPDGRVGTTDTAATLFCFSAPAKFLGNHLSWYNGSLCYELRFQNDGLTPGSVPLDVILIGGGLTLVADAGPDPATQTDTWIPFGVKFNESSWHLNTLDGLNPTASQLQTILSNVTALYIKGDFFSGLDTAWLDDVVATPPAPAGYWRFEQEATNGPAVTNGQVAVVLLDSSSNGINGTAVSGATPLSYRTNVALVKLPGTGLTNHAALAFDGVGDSVDLGTPAALQFSNALTIECSICPSNTTTIMNLVSRWDGYNRCAWVLNLNTADPVNPNAGTVPGLIGFMTSRDGGYVNINKIASNYRVKPNEWTHIAAVCDGASMKIYVNGVLDVSAPASGSIQPIGAKVYLGWADDSSPWRFAGLMDEVRITGAALIPDQFLYQLIPNPTVKLTQAIPQPAGGAQVSLSVSNLWFKPNYSVTLEHCSQLGEAWQPVWTAPVSGNGTNCTLTAPETSGFYRARME